MRAKHPTVEHPVVRTHPETGRSTLYVNVGFTRSIVGMDDEEKRTAPAPPLPAVDHRRCAVPVPLAAGFGRVLGQPATQHVVSNDFLPAKRVMERVTIVGDKPF